MMKNIFAVFGILAVLLLSLGMTSAAVSESNISITLDVTSISDVSIGDVYTVEATIDNQNDTDVYVSFRTTGWDSWDSDATVATGTSADFTGTFTIPSSTPASRGVYVDVYNESNHSQKLFYISRSISLTYAGSTDITGCMNTSATNYNSAATVHDESMCIYSLSTSDTLCELEGYTEKGDLEIKDFDINNNGEGSDDEWQYLDQIEIEVEVENTDNDENIEDVEVMIMIFDNKIENGGNDVTNDFDIDDEVLDDIGKLKDGDEESVTFIIDELPSDLDDGKYYMYIMAYEDGNEAEQCTSEIDSGDFYFEFEIESVDYEDSIVVRGTDFETQMNTYCDQQNLEITIPVYNLGDDEEEKVLVNLYNPEMGIDEYIVINDLDNGDKEIVTFFINIPSDLTKEKYDLDVIVSFDWDDDKDDEDPLSYDEETSDTSIRLNILGCELPEPTITASLDSATQIGQNLIVKATIKNNDKVNDFIITASDFDSWADLVSVTPQTATIASGNSQEVIIILSPKQSGAQTFKITTIVDGETYSQPVSVNISEEPGMFSGLGLNKTTLYLLVGIAALLILIFIVLIVKVSRSPTKEEF